MKLERIFDDMLQITSTEQFWLDGQQVKGIWMQERGDPTNRVMLATVDNQDQMHLFDSMTMGAVAIMDEGTLQ